VFSTKQKILSSQPISQNNFQSARGETNRFFRFLFQPRFAVPAFASLLIILFFSLSFTVAQNAVPGEPLYSLKKVAEKIELAVASPEEEPLVKLELTQERFKELEQVAQESKNQGRKLAASITETQKAVAELSETLSQTSKTQNDKQISLEPIIQGTAVIKTQNENIAQKLNADIIDVQNLENSLINVYIQYIEDQIAELENKSLIPEDQELLSQAKELFSQTQELIARKDVNEAENINNNIQQILKTIDEINNNKNKVDDTE
jgi:hypothetical protein